MRTALQRQITATGWQAVGFFGALFLLALGIFFYGQHIEGRIDTVVIERHRDHKVLRGLVHEARPVEVQVTPNLSKDLEQGSDEGAVPAPSEGDGPAPEGGSVGTGKGEGHDTPDETKPPSHTESPPPQANPGGTPTNTATVTPSPPAAVPEPEDSGGSTGETQHESVLESAGATVGEVVQGTGEVLEATTCGLTGPLLCPKR